MSGTTVVARLRRHLKKALGESGLTAGKRLVVAVSGGPDSLALLDGLDDLRADLGLELHGAHLDHGLRGDASRSDASFVSDAFRSLGIAHTSERADVKAFQREHGLSLEQAAREVRYSFLATVARDVHADAVAVAHTLDDQAETVLMHIIRGSGLTGLRGMQTAARLTFDEVPVILVRPLLGLSRNDTAEYCRDRGLEPRLDESNLSTGLGRNRVRLDLLPRLEEYNPAVRAALVRLSRSAAQDLAHLDSGIDGVWEEAVRAGERHLSLDTAVVKQLPPALQSHLLRRAVAVVKGNTEDIEQGHIEGMEALIAGPAGRSLDLPAGLRFIAEYGRATLSRADANSCPLPLLDGKHPLNIPGETLVCGWRVTAEVRRSATSSSGSAGCSRVHTARLGYETLGDRLWLRTREPGDRFQPLGMAHTKKLQDFMVDAKIPRRWRDRVPLIVSERGIAWVAGWRIAEWAKEDRDGGPTLELRLTPL